MTETKQDSFETILDEIIADEENSEANCSYYKENYLSRLNAIKDAALTTATQKAVEEERIRLGRLVGQIGRNAVVDMLLQYELALSQK